MKRSKSIDTILFLGKDSNEKQEASNILKVISALNYFEPDLLLQLKKKKIVNSTLSIAHFKFYLEKKDFYYEISKGILKYSEDLPIEGEFNNEALHDFLLAYTDEKLKFYRQEISKYKIIYNKVFNYLINRNYALLDKWILANTLPLIDAEEHTFLFPILNETFRLVGAKGNAAKESQGAISIIRYWISKYYIQQNRYQFGQTLLSDSITGMKSLLEKENDSGKETVLNLKTQLGEAYLDRGILNTNRNRFTAAIDDLSNAKVYTFSISTIQNLSFVYRQLGYYFLEEGEIINWAKWINTTEIAAEYYQQWVNITLLELVKHYFEAGLDDASIIVCGYFLSRVDIDQNGEGHLFAYAYYHIIDAKRAITNSYDAEKLLEINKNLLAAVAKFKAMGKYNQTYRCYLALAKIAIYLKSTEQALNLIKSGLEALADIEIIHSRFYIEFYLLYISLFEQDENQDDIKEQYNYLYKLTKNNLGSHHPFNRNIIRKLQQFSTEAEKSVLHNHYNSIEQLINPNIRLNKFTSVELDFSDRLYDELTKTFVHITNTKELRVLRKDQVLIDAFQVPFFKTYKLLRYTIKISEPKIIRYYLTKNGEDIKFLDGTNKAILEVAEEDFVMETEDSGESYIRFFFDIVEGKSGKFYFIEDLDKDIPWSYDVTEEEKQKDLEIMKKYVEPLHFLYKEKKKTDMQFVTVYHFEGYIFFRDSLFRSKIALREDGQLSLYGEELVHEALHICVDIKSTFLSN